MTLVILAHEKCVRLYRKLQMMFSSVICSLRVPTTTNSRSEVEIQRRTTIIINWLKVPVQQPRHFPLLLFGAPFRITMLLPARPPASLNMLLLNDLHLR